MAHVSSAELQAFVTTGRALATFDEHVERCARCAGRLEQAAAQHLAPPRAWPTMRLEVVVALAMLALLVVWPRSSSEPRLRPIALSGDLMAGVPDSGVVEPRLAPVVLVASNDGGDVR